MQTVKRLNMLFLLGDEELKNEEFILKNMNEGTQTNYKISQLESMVIVKIEKIIKEIQYIFLHQELPYIPFLQQ